MCAQIIDCMYIYIYIYIYIFLTLDFHYNCSFNARAYFERALVLLGVNVGRYCLLYTSDAADE